MDDDGKPITTLKELILRVQKNGIVMVTFTDSSYLGAFYTSYQISHLDQYSNFIVVAMDLDGYHVLSIYKL